MSENIRTIDLSDNLVVIDRDIASVQSINSIDINQVDGTFCVVEPYDIDGGYNGRVVIYPQSPVQQVVFPVILDTMNRVGSLLYPLDAKFDYLRRKIWIADTGNNRVLKVNLNTNQIDLSIDEGIVFPHALAVDFNTGNIFIKGYDVYDANRGAIYYFRSDGVLLSIFLFNRYDLGESSSSGDESSVSDSMSSDSSISFPSFPSSYSIVYDHVRSRAWWVDGIRIYMLDMRNKQIQDYDIRGGNYYEALSVRVEFSTGNAFVVVKNIHNNRFILQMSRDNNILLGSAYIAV